MRKLAVEMATLDEKIYSGDSVDLNTALPTGPMAGTKQYEANRQEQMGLAVLVLREGLQALATSPTLWIAPI